MDLNIMMSVFAGLALVVLFLVIVVAVKIQRKVAHNTALIKAHKESAEAKKAAKKKSGGGNGDGENEPGASRNFRPSE